MKFLLTALNAKYIHSNPALYSLRAYAAQQDRLGAGAVGEAALDRPKPQASEGAAVPGGPVSGAADVEIAEYTINQSVDDIAASIYEKRPDVIAISCYIWNWRMVQDLIRILGAILPEVPLWLGGPEVSFHTEQVLEQFPQLTGVMVGEGEVTFSQLLAHYRAVFAERGLAVGAAVCAGPEQAAGAPLSDAPAALAQISGIVYRDAKTGSICRTAARELTDISELPFYYEDMADFANRIVYYESSRGCPYRCSYCLSSIDKKVRLRNLELVKKELQFFLDKKVPQVKFIDRTFNIDHTHALEIWRYIMEHDNGVTNFHFEVAAGILKEEELCLLSQMRPGLVQLEIGVQTTNEKTLEAIRRREDLNRLKEVVARLKAGRNIHIHLDLIAGLPYEDLESFRHSFDDVYRMEPSQLQLGFLKVLKGAHMEETAAEYGIGYQQAPPYEVLYTRWISYEDLRLLKRVEEMVELFYNSGQFTHTIPALERCFETPFALYEALADFYKRNGYAVNSPSRMERYRLLLAFALEVDEKRAALWKELLTFDLYLRENCKSRPEFSPDQEAWKPWAQEFYQKEEQERTWLPGYEAYSARQMQRMTHLEVFRWPVQEAADTLLAAFDGNTAAVGALPCGGEAAKCSRGGGAAVDSCGTAVDGIDVSGRTAILFDYQKRNPLDDNAVIHILNITELK